MTDLSESLGELLNFLWNHDEITDFSKFLGEILKFLWNHDEITDFSNILDEILKFLWNHDEMTDVLWKFKWNLKISLKNLKICIKSWWNGRF